MERDDPQYVRKVGNIKKNLGLQTICKNKAVCLMPFVMEIFKLKFEEEPDYMKLKFKLMMALL